MKIRNENRNRRSGVLPTALLMLAFGASFGSVGHAESTPQDLTVTAKADDQTGARELRGEMQSTARDAAWLTRVSVATDLGVRLNSQHHRFRLASRETGKRG